MTLATTSQTAITNHGTKKIEMIAEIPAITPSHDAQRGILGAASVASDAAIIIAPIATPPAECITYQTSSAAWISSGSTARWPSGSLYVSSLIVLTPASMLNATRVRDA